MNDNDFYASERARERYGEIETVGKYTARTFLWMFVGLAVTFGVAIMGAATGLIYVMLSIPFFQLGLLIAELVVVLVLASRIQSLSITGARALFIGYSVLNGFVFSFYFIYFRLDSLILVFGATAIYFGALAVFGYFTNADLSRLRSILVGGLFFLIIFGVLSMFIPGLYAMERIYCLVGIAIFLGFTAYDTQKIKYYHDVYGCDPEMARKASIYAALQLYLDFINLFLYLLRFLGRRKN